jgi:hypothetical protein
MKHKLKYWAVNAALFIPTIIGLVREAGIVAVNAGAILALAYLGQKLLNPVINAIKHR